MTMNTVKKQGKPPRYGDHGTGRITVTEQVSHNLKGEAPVAVSSSFYRPTETTEQPVIRHGLIIGEDWESLPVGWLTSCEVLVLTNDEGRKLTKVPTPEEWAEIESRVLEFGVRALNGDPAHPLVVIPVGFVRPRTSNRYSPLDLSAVYVRCRKFRAKYSVAIFPR